MLHRYKAWNGPMPTTAAQASVSTGTAIKTMLQISNPSTRMITVLAWGFTIDDPPGADAVFELIETDVAATGGTAHVAAGVQPVVSGAPASLMTLGTGNTGYTFTTEGTITATKVHDVVSMSSVSAEAAPFLTYTKKFEDYEMPQIAVSRFLRVRATTPTTAVDMRCWIIWEE
jgi:hypothetical protein